MKRLYLHKPAIIKLKESAELPDPLQLEQYQISCDEEEDKFVLLYSRNISNIKILFANSY